MKTEDNKNTIILDDSNIFESWTLTNKLRYKRKYIALGDDVMTEILELQQLSISNSGKHMWEKYQL